MVKSNVKSLLIILLTVIIIASFQKKSFAASDNGLAGLLLDENTTLGASASGNSENSNTQNNNTQIDNNVANNELPVTTPPVLNSQPTPTISGNTQSTLPKTGENDIYIVSVLIGVFAVVTIYAYKKIRDYNGL